MKMVALSCLIFAFAAIAEDFNGEVEKAQDKYKDFFDQQDKLVLQDRLFDANAALIARAETEKSPIFDFIVANKLYDMDPDAAYRIHQRVMKARPEVPEVNLEWAMVCHRRGEYQSAIQAYEVYLKAHPEDGSKFALLADCYIRTNKFDEAIAAWQHARHGNNHTGIDFAIYAIYGGVSPQRKRADLLKKFDEGDMSVIETLIQQDLVMEDNWWNSHMDVAALDRDIVRAERALGKDIRRHKELSGLVSLLRKKEVEGKEVREQLKALHILIDGGELPVDSIVASHFFRLALAHKLAESKDLVARFSKELEERAKSKIGDLDALNILCVFYSEAEDWRRVSELDQFGWDRYKDTRFVEGLLSNLLQDKKLTLETPEFKKALAEFPENNLLWAYRLKLLGAENITAEDAAGAIKSQYHELSGSLTAMKDSYTLKGYFFLLEKLRKPK